MTDPKTAVTAMRAFALAHLPSPPPSAMRKDRSTTAPSGHMRWSTMFAGQPPHRPQSGSTPTPS